ncbi:pilus assembly protein CpaE [Gibbsiella quercinecans]|uniref:Pilus assembly protein CpaE n=1 Tax=Gibbsiella quercinecans TaxID=929813 RepID=A0A250AZ57_9GAMM|nr:hypothetical protein [Gibbsiella quercinecans]ATA19268.1 hypothetical protein AWC35_07870 [Gibbsiella quercinecans]RLM11089.1 hypothetical protein BIY30_09070 [Gibbsiella quercinecans]TCT87800.1 pilus assembly protein CpaE [Gibbsiella quercinecans]
MKLFSDAKKKSEPEAVNKSKKSAAQSIVVISPDKEILSDVTSLLLINNFKNVIGHPLDFFALQDDSILRDAATVIIDIANCNDVTLICETATLLIPASARHIFLGNNDSIAFAQALSSTGFCYLHIQSQLAQLAGQLQQSDSALAARSTMKISLLGCKGGAGTSSVAWQLFQAIGMQTSIPSLLVQGASGSRDLDLITSHALPRDGAIIQINEHQSACIESLDGAWNYDDNHFNRFNLVMFEHGVYTQPNEHLETIFTSSNTLILVINRDLSALRVAKRLLDEKQRMALSRNGKELRVFICLNESRPAQSDELHNEDIEEYLACPLSVVNPWSIKKNKALNGTPLWHFAAQTLLGKPADAVKKRSLSSLFKLHSGRKS